MAWLVSPQVCHKSENVHLESLFYAKAFWLFPRDIQKGDWSQTHFFSSWKNTSIHWQRAVRRPHPQDSKGLLQGICSVKAECVTQFYTGARAPGHPPVTSRSSCFEPPFYYALNYIVPLPDHALFFYYWGLSNLTKSLISERYKEIKLWEHLLGGKAWKADFI